MMNQEDIFKKIGQILNELNDQYQYLAQNSQDLNELELELFLANANFLSDHVQIIRKLNNNSIQKTLPEHTQEEEVVLQPAPLPVIEFQQEIHETPEPEILQLKPSMEDDIFKPDNEPSPFEFILNEKTSDKFEFEEKSVDEIFDRPLSKEEALIIAQKQKLREKDSLQTDLPEEDEIGPEPFLVAESSPQEIEAEEEETPELAPSYSAFKDQAASTAVFLDNKESNVSGEPETVPLAETVKEVTPTPLVQAAVIREEPVVIPQQPAATQHEPAALQEEPAVIPQEPVTARQEAAAQEEIRFAQPAPTPVQQTPSPVQQTPPPVQHIHETPAVTKQEPAAPAQPAAKLTLNEILSGNTKPKNYYSENNRTPVQDLKQAISLNDKMRYIKDLFNGYNLAYAEAIDLLNKMPDFKSADYFLQKNYAVKNNWADKQETADQFYELLQLRFPA